MNLRFIFRELVHCRGQAVIFILCVALSLVSIVAVDSFRRDVRNSIMRDAKSLQGGDIIIHSHYPFSSALEQELQKFEQDQKTEVVRTWEFYSMARSDDKAHSVLSNIKVVDAAYPLYGYVTLRSQRPLHEIVLPGQIAVGQPLLDRLNLEVGDYLLLGKARLKIVDVITAESQRPVRFFNFGPRIIVSSSDLEKLDLVKKGSRIAFETLIKVTAEQSADIQIESVHQIADDLQRRSIVGQERVSTFDKSESRIKRFFDNLFFFLSLISIFTLLLAGIGMQSSLAALLRRKEKGFAILRSIGSTSTFLLMHYLALVLVLGSLGCGVGIIAGFGVQKILLSSSLLSSVLPENIVLTIGVQDVLEGLLLGGIAIGFFTILPLTSIKTIKPLTIFRKENSVNLNSAQDYILLLAGIVLLAGLVIRQLEDIRIGLYFLASALGLILVLYLGVRLFLFGLSRLQMKRLVVRQAIRSLLRPGNSTRSTLVTLASALSVLLTIELLQSNLHATYIASYPEDAPNLFCLDIQKSQKEQFLQLVGDDTILFPVIRARLTAINGKQIKREEELKKRGDSLAREFNLTYRTELLADERLIEGDSVYGEQSNDLEGGLIPVSILDYVAKMGSMSVGDILSFNIQGVPLRAKVTSVRSRNKSMLYPFFYFVFPPEPLQAAPQTSFAALRLEESQISALENQIVNSFPNISTINVSQTAVELAQIVEKLSKVVYFFGGFSILAGALILVSSILATRLERIQEAAYYKILGAGGPFVLHVILVENSILALSSGLCAVFVGQIASWAVCTYLLQIEHQPYLLSCGWLLLATVLCTGLLGTVSSIAIIRRKPIEFLREQV